MLFASTRIRPHGIPCTEDVCNEATDSCDHVPRDDRCDDGLPCDGKETCQPGQGCVAGTPVSCPADAYACTIDACDDATGQCATKLDSSLCPVGELCVAGAGCLPTSCSNDSDCDDGNACNGIETCNTSSGVCVAGTPVDCNDAIACTVDVCDPATGACSHTPVDAACSDGDACNGTEACDPVQGCISGTPLDCDDGIACTTDSCLESSCRHTPDDSACSGGDVCHRQVCDATQGCVAGPPTICPSDGVDCTVDACDPTLGCVHTRDNSACSCGQTCDPKSGCGHTCVLKTCQGRLYQCGNCIDDDGDCRVDAQDPDCTSVCATSESNFFYDNWATDIMCRKDCYFDGDRGSGNDDCYASHKCDPNEVAPNYDPWGHTCSYDPTTPVVGAATSCAELYSAQSARCLDYCLPLTPNGCDCFGCCLVPGAPTAVFLGSGSELAGTCDAAHLDDPTKCRPCQQLPSCLNPCGHCELCLGKTTLPADCPVQDCPAGVARCGLPSQAPCDPGYYCVTGCCQPTPL